MDKQERACREILNIALSNPDAVTDCFKSCVQRLALMRGRCSDPLNPFASVAYERMQSWMLQTIAGE